MATFSVMQTVLDIPKLAAQGRRWFATPPRGFAPPPPHIMANMAMMSTHLFGQSSLNEDFANYVLQSPIQAQTLQLSQLSSMQRWMRQNGPTIFVPEDIVDACENTDALSGVEGTDIRRVFTTVYVSLPESRGFVSPFNGDTVRHIWCNFVEADEPVSTWLNGEERRLLAVKGRRLLITAYWGKSMDCSSYSLPLDEVGVPLKEVIARTSKSFIRDEVRYDDNPELERGEKTEIELLGPWLASLCVNLTLLAQSYPEYLHEDKSGKTYRQSFKDLPEPRMFTIVRSGVRSVRQIVDGHTRSDLPGVTGSAHRVHWRRGHWRRQPHGDQWELTNPNAQFITLTDGRHAHMTWLEPVFVGMA